MRGISCGQKRVGAGKVGEPGVLAFIHCVTLDRLRQWFPVSRAKALCPQDWLISGVGVFRFPPLKLFSAVVASQLCLFLPWGTDVLFYVTVSVLPAQPPLLHPLLPQRGCGGEPGAHLQGGAL